MPKFFQLRLPADPKETQPNLSAIKKAGQDGQERADNYDSSVDGLFLSGYVRNFPCRLFLRLQSASPEQEKVSPPRRP